MLKLHSVHPDVNVNLLKNIWPSGHRYIRLRETDTGTHMCVTKNHKQTT
jgi:hypothetical protein